jgi:hypothetical protein
MKCIILILASCLAAGAQLSGVRASSMRYNDQTGTTGRVMSGDTLRCGAQTIGGFYYCIYNDGNGPAQSPPGIANRNFGYFKLSLDLSNVNNTAITLIDSTTNYGTINQANTNLWINNSTFKTGGIAFFGGNAYVGVHLQCQGTLTDCSGAVVGGEIDSTIIVSTDATSASPNHWCNPKTWAANSNTCPVNATTAGGDPPQGPTADSAVMWPGQTHMGSLLWVQYGSGDTTDNNSTYCYALSNDSILLHRYLSRVPCTSIMDVTTWQYYKGPIAGDVNNSSNWCTGAYSSCAASHTVIDSLNYPNANYQGGTGYQTTLVHLGAPWNSYAGVSAFNDSAANVHQRLHWAPSMTGPFSPVTMDGLLGTTTGTTPGLGFPQLLLDTVTVTDAGQKRGTITAISGGEVGGSGPTIDYSPYWSTYTLGPGSFTSGPLLKGNGMLTQGNSRIRFSQGMVSGSIPAKGLQMFWGFDEQAALPTLWPLAEATELVGGTTCVTLGSNKPTLSGIGMSFAGTNSGSANASRCVTAANAPAFFAGNGTYSIFAIYKNNSASLQTGALTIGTSNTTLAELFIGTSFNSSGDFSVGYPTDNLFTAGSLVSTSNYYFHGYTKQAGLMTAGNSVQYLNGRVIASSFGGFGTPAIANGPIVFGAYTQTQNSNYLVLLNGNIVATVIYNRVLSPPEVYRLYRSLKTMALRRGITLQ